ncbi:MAG: MFS transporter [Proteobacteria bacterium]|nr:MFS transporter [Pseudomonadota bacterium]
MEKHKDAYFRRNVAGVAGVEFFWGLGFPLVMESTFLQLFLKSLGASSFTVGIVPSLFVFCISTFPLFSSYLSRNHRYKRTLVAYLHMVSGLAILILGLVLPFFSRVDDVLLLFFTCYTVFSLCLGLTIPIWYNYLTRIFSEPKTVPGLGYMMLAQNIGKVVSSFFILKVVDIYAFSLGSSAWVFTTTGLLFIIGALCFFFTKELPDPNDPERDNLSFLRHTGQSFREIIRNRRFLIYLAADLDIYVILTVMSFYANYATGFFEVPAPVAAGAFVACIYAGSITVNIFLGTMNLLALKQKLYLSKGITFLLLVLLAFSPDYMTFFLISYLLGVGRAIRNMVYPPSVKKFAGKTDATAYFALAPILTLPIGSGFPLLFGKILDTLSFMGADAYRLLFACSALFILATLYFTVRTDYEG